MNIYTNMDAPKIEEIATEEHNDIFINGYVHGIKSGAEMLIQHLQSAINDNGAMSDAGEIKMMIFNVWKSICIYGTSFNVQEHERKE